MYASRGGYKLKRAIDYFKLDLKDKVCLDIGASTGGFVDVMLREGAKIVYAVDVGYGQLDWKLRKSNRVICLEKKNARYITTEDIPKTVDLITIDVSFISVKKIIPNLVKFLNSPGGMIILIKPQFEAERKFISRGGILKSGRIHCDVIDGILKHCKDLGFILGGLTYSPIKGASGNIEYLMYFLRGEKSVKAARDTRKIVEEASDFFSKEESPCRSQ